MATEYGTRLRQSRRNAGLTQVELSEKTGIAQSTISTAERQGAKSSDTAIYAQACGVNAYWLATGKDSADQRSIDYEENQPLARVERAQAATNLVAESTKLCPLSSAIATIAALMESLPADDKTTVESLITNMLRKPVLAPHVVGAIAALVGSAKETEAKQQPPAYRTGTHD